MRITNKVFYDLAIWMVIFGLCIGTVFPFFVMLLGVPADIALKTVFFTACLGAGALAGILNYGLARWTVGSRLKLLASSMSQVEQNLNEMTFNGDTSKCTPEHCQIAVDSKDEIGESAVAFNRLVESLSVSIKTQAAVRSFSRMLTSQLEVEGLADKVLENFFEHTGAGAGLILNQSDGAMKVAASRGVNNPDLAIVTSYVQNALRTGQKQLISIPRTVLVEWVEPGFRPGEVVVLPVTNKDALIGVVILATGQKFDAIQLGRIDLFIQGLGLALNNAMTHDRLRYLATVDPLTGIFNRRFGMRRLQEEFSKALRSNASFGILIFDIDYFKVVNDTYGHLVGDCALKSVCAIARASLRDSDILFRYGGEEFVAVLPAATEEDLCLSGERLRKAIEDATISADDKTVRVTVCIGGVAFPEQPAENVDHLIQLADEALYLAKNLGRNKVQIARKSAGAPLCNRVWHQC